VSSFLELASGKRNVRALAPLHEPVVLIEIKKRCMDLPKHYRQAFDYWTHLIHGRGKKLRGSLFLN
jgi:hypothetical protein